MSQQRTLRPFIVLLMLFIVMSMASVALASQTAPLGEAVQQEGPTAMPTLPIGDYAPPSEPPVTEVPPPMPIAAPPDGDDVVNVLLIGSDTDNPANSGRTDSLMIVSVNRTEGTTSFLSLPRDLFVYIPGWTMQRINTAFGHGNQVEYEGGGYGLLHDTILYNLGIDVHFHVRVNFASFQQLINALGGIEITVDCTLQDWRLITPDLDPTVEDNWELFTLPVGVQEMDGDLALWYARSRRTSSDFDRGRRQQDILRAVWYRLRELGLLNQLPELWGQLSELVETDMQLQDVLGMVPLALSIDSSRIAFYTFRANEHVTSWSTPAGSSVQLPVREAVTELLHDFMQPPTANQLAQRSEVVEVVNASGYPGLDRVAADRLAREGFIAIAAGDLQGQYNNFSSVYDYTGSSKGSALPLLLSVLRMNNDNVLLEPNPDSAVDYRVIIGGSYHACTHGVLPPVEVTPPTTDAVAAESNS